MRIPRLKTMMTKNWRDMCIPVIIGRNLNSEHRWRSMVMEDSKIWENCEKLGRFLEGNASESDTLDIRSGYRQSLSELLFVSLLASRLIKG